MKKKEFTGLRNKTTKELMKLAHDKKSEAAKLKMEISAGKNKNLKAFKNLRREIAQILTLVREMEIVEKIKGKKEGKETLK